MMKRNYLLLSWLFASLLVVSSCKRDFIYGDIHPNTDRIIVEFTDAKDAHSIAMDYTASAITVDVADLQFMVRSSVTKDETVKIRSNSDIVNDYNAENGTTYSSVPLNLFGFESTDIVLSASVRKKKVRLRIKPSDVAIGEWAIGLEIVSTSSGEVSQLAKRVVLLLSVKNKYDGKYHMKGFYVRTDAVGAPYNGPFETDVQMITTGPASVAMYSDELGGYAQPFFDYGSGGLTGFGNVGPEVTFNASDQASGIVNYTGAPVMTLFPGANSRYVGGATPVIYLKYYYNADPTNRLFADTLIYTGPR